MYVVRLDVVALTNVQLNPLASDRYGSNFIGVISDDMFRVKSMSTAFTWMAQNIFNDKFNIGSGNGLAPSGHYMVVQT